MDNKKLAADKIKNAIMDIQEYIGNGEYNGDNPPIYLLTATLAIKALENQIPIKPNLEGDGYDNEGNLIYGTWLCPNCDAHYEIDYDDYNYCPICGQKVDLSDIN
ncbi:MAG: hypothetical protein J6C37_06140 [Roseburia sp.]|jgi:hypothetical protein|nr:hypothetical protein [Roseburia sp.]